MYYFILERSNHTNQIRPLKMLATLGSETLGNNSTKRRPPLNIDTIILYFGNL